MDMIAHEDFEKAKTRLCDGKDAVVALINDERRKRFEQWQTQLDWTAPHVRAYRQRDTKVVIEVATF